MLMMAASGDVEEASLHHRPHPVGIVGGHIVSDSQEQSHLCVEEQGEVRPDERGGRCGEAWENVHQKPLI